MVPANAMVVAWQTDFMYIEYRQLFLLNCSDRVQCSSFHIGYAACLPVGVVDLPMNTIDGGWKECTRTGYITSFHTHFRECTGQKWGRTALEN